MDIGWAGHCKGLILVGKEDALEMGFVIGRLVTHFAEAHPFVFENPCLPVSQLDEEDRIDVYFRLAARSRLELRFQLCLGGFGVGVVFYLNLDLEHQEEAVALRLKDAS
ncbi:MAG: hypothetical protein Q8P50_03245 [Bacillota bacterium]|nr:hypothetical protein [Bacillota bacterium]